MVFHESQTDSQIRRDLTLGGFTARGTKAIFLNFLSRGRDGAHPRDRDLIEAGLRLSGLAVTGQLGRFFALM